MSNKKTRALAQQIYNYEMICQNPLTSKEDKNKAEQAMADLTRNIMQQKDGISILLQIDSILMKILNNKEK